MDDYRYFTRDEALATARSEASRFIEQEGNSIRYVTFDASVQDYCLVEFVAEVGGLVKTSRALPLDDRIEGEEISDARIRALALEGKTVTAIRLYRVKHGVGLRDARAAVEALYCNSERPEPGPRPGSLRTQR